MAGPTWNMADGLYGVVGGVDYGEEGGEDPEQDGGAHQRYRSDIQLVLKERPFPRQCFWEMSSGRKVNDIYVTPGMDISAEMD